MTKPCGRWTLQAACAYPRMKGKQRCVWHWLLTQSADVQKRHAAGRLSVSAFCTEGTPRRMRVPAEEWPTGERWCAGCQSFVPFFYVSGSRCKSCASSASHEARVRKVYGLEPGEYDKLLALQGGRCYICGRKSLSRRLAVDHDHETGNPRGLLCPDQERGCNHKVLGLLEANATDSGLAAARRLVDYLEDPPYSRMLRGEAVWEPLSGADDPTAPF
jgi:hypothetical protein